MTIFLATLHFSSKWLLAGRALSAQYATNVEINFQRRKNIKRARCKLKIKQQVIYSFIVFAASTSLGLGLPTGMDILPSDLLFYCFCGIYIIRSRITNGSK